MTATVPESKLVAAHDRETPWLDPEDFVRANRSARERGLDVVGIWHSHPDAPAVPSATDAESAWEGWAYLIVSVVRSRSCEIRSWRFRSPFFTEQSIEEIPHHV